LAIAAVNSENRKNKRAPHGALFSLPGMMFLAFTKNLIPAITAVAAAQQQPGQQLLALYPLRLQRPSSTA
jgi:hypothetical protein